MDEVVKIVTDIKNGVIKPIYFLMGEEPYYIDKLSDFIEQKVLTEEEKGFNQTVLYGRDVTIDDIVSAAKRYPMMADRQVIIVKEAQDLSRNIEKLENYADNPMPSTVLVMCYKYKTLDKRKKVTKLLAKNGLVFELRKALGERNQLKAYKIAANFAQNPKEYPIVVTTGMVFGFFIQLLKYHGLKDKNPKNVAAVLGINPFFVKEYDLALKNYPMKKVSQIVGSLREIDVKSKGVGANQISQSDLLREMLYKIFN